MSAKLFSPLSLIYFSNVWIKFLIQCYSDEKTNLFEGHDGIIHLDLLLFLIQSPFYLASFGDFEKQKHFRIIEYHAE